MNLRRLLCVVYAVVDTNPDWRGVTEHGQIVPPPMPSPAPTHELTSLGSAGSNGLSYATPHYGYSPTGPVFRNSPTGRGSVGILVRGRSGSGSNGSPTLPRNDSGGVLVPTPPDLPAFNSFGSIPSFPSVNSDILALEQTDYAVASPSGSAMELMHYAVSPPGSQQHLVQQQQQQPALAHNPYTFPSSSSRGQVLAPAPAAPPAASTTPRPLTGMASNRGYGSVGTGLTVGKSSPCEC